MIDALAADWWLPLIIAPFIGSFLGVLITRLPAGEAVVVGRSRCRWCGHVLGVLDLVPLLSWFATRRRCRYCGSEIGWFYPSIELAAIVVPAWAATEVGGWLLWVSCAFGWVLLTLAVIDARHLLLPDVLTLPLLVAGLAVAAWIDGCGAARTCDRRRCRFCGVLVDRPRLSSRSRPRGTGNGRRKVLGGGWRLGIMAGTAERGLYRRRERARVDADQDRLGATSAAAQKIPFGTYLCLGTWLVWLYGPVIVG